MKTVYCKCGYGQEIEDGNIYIHGHNRRGLPSHVIPEDKWSMEYDECVECGTTEIPYGGRGLCKRCYKHFFYEMSKTKEKWSLKYKCCIDCGRTDRPYHANGRCGTCDSNYRNRLNGVKKKNVNSWANYYKKCTKCNTTERPHTANGLCCDCYEEEKRVGKVLEKCPVCGVKVEKLNQHLSMRAKKCEKHLKYLRDTYKMYFDSDLGLADIAKELNAERHLVTDIFRRLFGIEETKKRNIAVKSCLCSARAKIGFNNKNRFGTVVYYDSINNGKVRFRSKLERAYAGYLDVSGINWDYESDSFPYIDDKGKRRTYTPDFYLTETEEYIEIKGYDRGDTDYKIDKMKEIGITIKVVRNKDFQQLKNKSGV